MQSEHLSCGVARQKAMAGRSILWITIIGGIAFGAPRAGLAEKRAIPGRQAICGPQCVQLILAQYGEKAKLLGLIDEIQGTRIEEGSSMDALRVALQQRGLHTCPMKIGEDVRIEWPHPVLLHLKGQDVDNHFAVQLPSPDSSQARIWLRPGELRMAPWEEAACWRSGTVLLTAPEPIRDPHLAFHSQHKRWWWLAVPVGSLFLCFPFFRYLTRKKET